MASSPRQVLNFRTKNLSIWYIEVKREPGRKQHS